MMKKANALAWGKLRYGQLVVTDSNGKLVPATLTSNGNRILLAINDSHATYPLTVDPLVWIEQKVTASDGAKNDYFGISVALDGATALVGAWSKNNEQGAAYIFTESAGTWSQTQELTASDGAAGDAFGISVALDGTTALVGANSNNDEQGAVYVFTESGGTWSQAQKLTASDGVPGNFGTSVAVDGTTVLIGALFANSLNGAAYVFTDADGTWDQTQEFTANDGAEFDLFGLSVALDGATALVGAEGNNNSQGAAYIFIESGGSWSQTQKLTAGNGAASDQFGHSVALDGTVALVGAAGNDNQQGAVYVFTASDGSWNQTQEITANDGAAGDYFGTSVALNGTTALVGAGGNNDWQGAAYVFTETSGTWGQAQELTASDGVAGDDFGDPVALDGTTALIGSPCSGSDPSECDGPGATYFYGRIALGLSPIAPQSVGQGQQYVSQAIVTNNSSAASPAVAVTMAVPAAASFVSASSSQGSCSEDSDVVTCNFGAIDGNAGTATANLTLKATGNAGTTIANVAGVAKATPSLTASAPTVIQKANSPPVAQNGTLMTDENTAANGTLDASDPDGDPLTFLIVDKPKHGTVSQEVKGSNDYLYTPDHGYSGADSFTFKASDGQADSNVATISITVKAASPPPSGGGGGGGATAPLGLGLLALVGSLAFLRRRR